MERQEVLEKGQMRMGNWGIKQDQEASIIMPGIREGETNGKGGAEKGRRLSRVSLSPLSSSPWVIPV